MLKLQCTCHCLLCYGGWFGVAVTAFVTSTKFSYTLSPVSTGIGDDLWRVYHSGIYPCQSGPLSLVIPPWVGAMSTGDGFGHLCEETAPLKLRPYGAFRGPSCPEMPEISKLS